METIGELLRKAREAKGVALEEASKKTKIHINILRALEEDRFEGLNPVYVKGFLKIYAQYLNINPQELIAKYQSIVPQGQSMPHKERNSVIREPAFKVSIINLLKRINFKFLLTGIVCFALIFVLSIAIKKYRQKIAINKALTTLKPTKRSPPSKTAIATKPATTIKPTTPKSESAIPVKVALRAKEDTWIKVALDGKVIFQGILKKGRAENWQAKQVIDLSIGNAGTVELEVNGRILSPLGRRGQTLKQVLINKEGLSIK